MTGQDVIQEAVQIIASFIGSGVAIGLVAWFVFIIKH